MLKTYSNSTKWNNGERHYYTTLTEYDLLEKCYKQAKKEGYTKLNSRCTCYSYAVEGQVTMTVTVGYNEEDKTDWLAQEIGA